MAKAVCCLILSLFVLAAVFEQSQGAANIIDIYKNVVFDYAVMKNPKPVVVFYYQSSTCPACKWSLKPMLEKMAKRKSDKLYLALVDFDKVPELQAQHGITSIPTTSVFYKGDVLDLVEGTSWSQIVPLVNEASKIV